jgi:hypothetical protein
MQTGGLMVQVSGLWSVRSPMAHEHHGRAAVMLALGLRHLPVTHSPAQILIDYNLVYFEHEHCHFTISYWGRAFFTDRIHEQQPCLAGDDSLEY